jgi:dCTP deaminase
MENGGILSGLEIKKALESGDIKISPYDPNKKEHLSRFNPASYDLTLGRHVAVYKSVVQSSSHDDWECDSLREDGTFGVPGERLRPFYSPGERIEVKSPLNCLDAAKENKISKYEMDDRGLVLLPGIGYLMHTEEVISTDKYVPILDGKSSIGRLFCAIHITAGLGDAGFEGQYTLEVVVTHPLVVYPGMRFCQIRFFTMVGDHESYAEKGNYKGALAEGPIPSQSWKMFR